MDRRAWRAAAHGVTTSYTQLSNFTFTFHFHALEKEMANHSSVLAWRIPGMGEPGGLPSMGSHRVGYDWRDLAAAAANCLLCPIFKVNPHCRPLYVLAQLCPTLCNPIDCSPRVSSVHGIFLARILKWVAFPPPRDPSDPGINLWLQRLLHWQVDSLLLSHLEIPLWSSIGQ